MGLLPTTVKVSPWITQREEISIFLTRRISPQPYELAVDMEASKTKTIARYSDPAAKAKIYFS
jgi:hypothetical protein